MGPTRNICALLLSATVFSQAQSSEKIDFKSVFHTPQKKYDDFEILERSNFEPDDCVGSKEVARCVAEKPKAIANAQVLVNFDSNKNTKYSEPCERLKQHPFVYFLPQVHHDVPKITCPAPHPVQVTEYSHHYHSPHCWQFPGFYYPGPCPSHVMPVSYSNLPAKVSKSCTLNLKHEIQTIVDPNEIYGLPVPCKSECVVHHPVEDVEVETQEATCDCEQSKQPQSCKVDEELILVGLAKTPERPLITKTEKLISFGLVKPTEKDEKASEISPKPGKTDEEYIAFIPTEPIEKHDCSSGKVHQEPESILVELTKPNEQHYHVSEISPKPFMANKEIILVDLNNPTEKHECEGPIRIPNTPPGLHEIQPVPGMAPISLETQRRILCTVENILKHLIHDDVNGMKPCEKLRIAEVLTQILVNLKREGQPSAVNEESLKVFFGFIKKIQEDYSIAKVGNRAGIPIPSLPYGPHSEEQLSNPTVLLGQLQSRIREVEEDPKKEKVVNDEEFADQYSLLLLSYLKTLHENKDQIKSPPSLPDVPKDSAREKIKEEILAEVKVPLLNQYVAQLNLDREEEKPLSNEDVLNFWVNSALEIPKLGEEVHIDDNIEIAKKKEKEILEEINVYKHIVESKPAEQNVTQSFSDKKEEIILLKPNTKPDAVGTSTTKQESDEYPTDLATLVKYLHLLNPNVAPTEAQVEAKPKKVDTDLLKAYVKVEISAEAQNKIKGDIQLVQKGDEAKEKDVPKEAKQQISYKSDGAKAEDEKKVKHENDRDISAVPEVIKDSQQKPSIELGNGHQDVQQKEESIKVDGVIKSEPPAKPERVQHVKAIEQTKQLKHDETGEQDKIVPIELFSAKQDEIIKAKNDNQNEIVKVDDIIKPDELNLLLLKQEKDRNVKTAEIIKHHLLHDGPQGKIVKAELPLKVLEKEQLEEIIRSDELNTNEKVIEANLQDNGQKEMVSNPHKLEELKALKSLEFYKNFLKDLLLQKVRHEGALRSIISFKQLEEPVIIGSGPEPYISTVPKKEEILLLEKETIPKKHGTDEVIKVDQILPILKSDDDGPEQFIRANEELEKDKTYEKLGLNYEDNPRTPLFNLKEVERFELPEEQTRKVNREEDIIEVGKEVKRPIDIQLITPISNEGLSLPSLDDYLEFIETKQEGYNEGYPVDKYIGFTKANEEGPKKSEVIPRKQLVLNLCVPLLGEYIEFLKTNKAGGNLKCLNLCLPFIGEYLSFAKSKGSSLPSAYIHFMKAKQEEVTHRKQGTIEESPARYLQFRDLPSLSTYVEFMKAKQGEARLKKCEATEDVLGFKEALPQPKKYVEFIEAKRKEEENPERYLKFKEANLNLLSVDEYNEFVKAKKNEPVDIKGHSNLSEYIEFMKGKRVNAADSGATEKYLASNSPNLNKYIEFIKSKQVLGFPTRHPNLNTQDALIEFMKASNLSLPKYIEFMKTKQEEITPEKCLNFKGLSTLDEHIEFVETKRDDSEKYLTFKNLGEYIEFMKAQNLNLSLPKYIEFMKANQGRTTPERYLKFKTLPTQDEYIEFMETKRDDPEKYLIFKKLGEYIEFTKAQNPNLSLPNYIEFMKAKQGGETTSEKYLNSKSLPAQDEYIEFVEAKQGGKCESEEEIPNLKDLTLQDIGDMWKIMDNLEYIKLKLDGLEKRKVCQCDQKNVADIDLGKLETPSGYEILTPKSCKYYHNEEGSVKRIFPHDIDDLSEQRRGELPNIFDLILPSATPEGFRTNDQSIIPIVHPQVVTSLSGVNTCSCGRKIKNGRCPSCAPYIKEFNE